MTWSSGIMQSGHRTPMVKIRLSDRCTICGLEAREIHGPGGRRIDIPGECPFGASGIFGIYWCGKCGRNYSEPCKEHPGISR